MTLLVCSVCRSPIPENEPHCPQCGRHGLAVVVSDAPAPDQPVPAERGHEAELRERLEAALGPQFAVGGLLGRGGFAEVYQVRDSDLQRELAVKVLRSDLAWTSGMMQRFKQEARAIARLAHPHIVPIFFVGEGEGLVFYAMPFIEGASLADLLRVEGPLDPDHAVAIVAPVLEALEYAHQHGIVHRDIKPDNVMIEHATGRPLLVDFGIAKQADAGPAHETQAGLVVGTPLYMSPEQALGDRNLDARADIYAVGAMLFQMVTGAPPFEGTTSQEIVGKHLNEPVPVPSHCNTRIPVWLSDVILCCMAKRPADRYESAAAALAALRQKQETGSTQAITAVRVARRLSSEAPTLQLSAEDLATPVPDSPAARRRRRRRGLAVAGVGLVGLGGLGAVDGAAAPAVSGAGESIGRGGRGGVAG